MSPTTEEQTRRDEIARRLLRFIEEDRRVSLPPFDPATARPSDQFALVNVGLEANDFTGTLGSLRYQFEGEEDLLHLIVTANGDPLTVADAQRVAAFVLDGVPPALVWLKPGGLSQHFYVGHDELIGSLRVE